MTTHSAVAAKRADGAKYFVACDECRETMRWTDSVRESAAGGVCPKCRAEINAKLAKVAARAEAGR